MRKGATAMKNFFKNFIICFILIIIFTFFFAWALPNFWVVALLFALIFSSIITAFESQNEKIEQLEMRISQLENKNEKN